MNINNFGCIHYQRGCKIIAPCCQKIFACRFCHDNEMNAYPTKIEEIHEINRFEIKEIVCSNCDTKQKVNFKCINCHMKFGNYFCDICNLFDYVNKGQKHCYKCGFCRVYGNDEYYHCDKCNKCIKSETNSDDDGNNGNNTKHKCTNIEDKVCPICFEDLFTSVKDITELKCGHWMHFKCLNNMIIKGSYKCPLCCKSIVNLDNYTQFMDNEIKNTIMPEELLDKKIDILCNECTNRSNINFHYLGLKCAHCGSYNTKQIKI